MVVAGDLHDCCVKKYLDHETVENFNKASERPTERQAVRSVKLDQTGDNIKGNFSHKMEHLLII